VNRLRILIAAAAALVAFTASAAGYDKVDKLAFKMPGSATKSCTLMAEYIKANAATEDEHLRMAYMWIAKNVSFDKGGDMDLTLSCSDDSVANLILKKKKAVCSGYAELFTQLCLKLGFQAYTVTGYTMLNKEVDVDGHAWNAVQLANGQWRLFDPMWGAGTLVKGKFSKKINDKYFLIEPSEFIKTHMPFDPLWQLMSYPVKAEAFYNGETAPKEKVYYSYNDTIAANSKLFKSEQLEALCRRLQWAGDVNPCTNAMMDICKQNIVILKKKEKYALENRKVNKFNTVVDRVNIVIIDYNKLVALKKTFRAKGISAFKLKELADTCNANLAIAQKELARLSFDDEQQRKQMQNLTQTIQSLQKQVNVQFAFLKKQKEFATKKKKKK
jgi:hypothetical protein